MEDAARIVRRQDEIAAAVAHHDADIANLNGWQKTQNGTLVHFGEQMDVMTEKLNQRMDALEQRMNTRFDESTRQIQTRFEHQSNQMQARFEHQGKWMMGVLGSLSVALLLLALDLAIRLI